jgi:hypothetical protein
MIIDLAMYYLILDLQLKSLERELLQSPLCLRWLRAARALGHGGAPPTVPCADAFSDEPLELHERSALVVVAFR